MNRLSAAAIGAGVLAVLAASGASADNAWEVENARANARAGGPISAYDAELLDRWGCLSGTRSAFCRHIRGGATSGWYRAKRRRRHR